MLVTSLVIEFFVVCGNGFGEWDRTHLNKSPGFALWINIQVRSNLHSSLRVSGEGCWSIIIPSNVGGGWEDIANCHCSSTR